MSLLVFGLIKFFFSLHFLFLQAGFGNHYGFFPEQKESRYVYVALNASSNKQPLCPLPAFLPKKKER